MKEALYLNTGVVIKPNQNQRMSQLIFVFYFAVLSIFSLVFLSIALSIKHNESFRLAQIRKLFA